MKILENNKFRKELIEVLSHIEKNGVEFSKKAKEEFADRIIRKVYEVVEKYSELSSNVDEEDLFQVVYEALLIAGKTDTSKFLGGFKAYAMMKVKENVEKLILKNNFNIPEFGDKSKKLLINIMDAVTSLTDTLGRTPTTDEIASELGEEEEVVREMIFTHNSYRCVTNLRGIKLTVEDAYSREDKIQFDLKEIVIELLENSNLNEKELCVILLYFGIVPKNKLSINYEGIDIVLDGEPKELAEIGRIISVTRERARQILIDAYYRLKISNAGLALGINDYAINPDLTLKLQSIYSWINIAPFTDRYPNFNSFFEGYTEEEIDVALKMLNDNDLLFIKIINTLDQNDSNVCYGIDEVKKLFLIIESTYNNLINLYGGRNISIDFCPYKNKQYGFELGKARNFFKNISDGDELVGLYAVTKLTDYERKTLFQIYGNNLGKILTSFDMFNQNQKIILDYKCIVYKLKERILKFEIDKCLPDIELMKARLVFRTKQNENEHGIYRILCLATPNMIDDVLDVLFIQELNILKEVFGVDLKSDNYLENYNNLDKIKQVIFNNIISYLSNCLEERLQKEKTNKRKQNKVSVFYEIFFKEGYSLEEIDDVFNNEVCIGLVNEYLKRGTSPERREQIVSIILTALNAKYGGNIIYRSAKPGIRQLKLSRIYNSLVSNI